MSHNGSSTGTDSHEGQSGLSGDFSNADILGSDMEGMSWSTVFEGLKVGTGIRFFIVFTAFIAWLYVIYWIRHHEPLADQVIGVSAPQLRTAAADRSLIAGVKRVFPFQTPAIASSSLYTPMPGGATSSLPTSNNYVLGTYNKSFGEANQQPVRMMPYVAPGQAISSPLIAPADQEFDQRFGSPAHL